MVLPPSSKVPTKRPENPGVPFGERGVGGLFARHQVLPSLVADAGLHDAIDTA
jgi:hypothetical protein